VPLMPKRVKFRKSQRRMLKGLATRGNTVAYGEYGIQALEPAWISARQIEAGRVAAQHFMGNEGKLWIRIFPHKPITAKPAEVRMGSGKGEPNYWAAAIKPGTVLYEIGGLSEDIAKQAMNRIAHKLPIRTRFVKRRAGL